MFCQNCQFIEISKHVTSGYCKSSVIGDLDELLFWHNTGKCVHSGTQRVFCFDRTAAKEENIVAASEEAMLLILGGLIMSAHNIMYRSVVYSWRCCVKTATRLNLQLLMLYSNRKWLDWRPRWIGCFDRTPSLRTACPYWKFLLSALPSALATAPITQTGFWSRRFIIKWAEYDGKWRGWFPIGSTLLLIDSAWHWTDP